MARRPRRLTETDQAMWANYARLIAPLPGKVPVAEPAVPKTPPVEAPLARAAPAPPPPKVKAPPLAVGTHPGGIDKATWQKFRTGRLVAARKLDLHGMTAQRAHTALLGFLRGAHADGVRCVEVVTGRGSGEAGGVIRREFPLWLNQPELRPLILGAAHPHALNPGSVRLILRRIR